MQKTPGLFHIAPQLTYSAAVQQQLPVGCRLVPLIVRGDDRGSLIPLEQSTGVPFPIARVYFIYGTKPGVSRGFHAHRALKQLAVSIAGSCTMVLDDGRNRFEVRLDSPEKGIEIGPMIWREMHDFSPDCVVAVLADAAYDEADYIRDYATFTELAGLG